MPHRNIDEKNAYRRRHYAANRELYLKNTRLQRAKVRALVFAAKDRPCTDCGVQYPHYVMQFDHVPGRGPKLFNIAETARAGFRSMQVELAKCDVVCANCHAERTHSRLV